MMESEESVQVYVRVRPEDVEIEQPAANSSAGTAPSSSSSTWLECHVIYLI